MFPIPALPRRRRIAGLLPLAAALPLLCGLHTPASAQDAGTPPIYQDSGQSIDKRVDDLVKRMTLEEKVRQMMTNAPAIPRLNIPVYWWWNESLHGNANAGIATIFPQAIGLASTWDLDLHHAVASATSDENRAKYNQTVRDNKPERWRGATFFSPNINIFRDPRWGRGQETYGEDPYLTARFGVAFITGMQGDDPRYLKVAATAKHYAVHSGPEPERHVFNAVVSAYDLNDTYLPAFEAAVREGHVASVMGAYSSLYGTPDCASPLLLQQILRDRWGFTGYVVSDCGAITDIANSHQFAPTIAAGDADAVKAGTDLACDGAYGQLVAAVKQGLVSEADIDRAVKRLFAVRFKLGMFDPQDKVAYASIPMTVVDSPEHHALALKAARESIVLLKNDGLLPLSGKIKSIAVIGPTADSTPALLGNYHGRASNPVTILQGIQQRAERAGVTVGYIEGVPLSETAGALSAIPGSALHSDGKPGLKGEYFNNETLDGTPSITRLDPQVRFDFGKIGPGAPLGGIHYSARWTGTLTAPVDGAYTLAARGDDGFRLYLNGEKVIDDWGVHPPATRTMTIDLKAGQAVPIKLEYYQALAGAEVSLLWHTPAAIPPAQQFADAVAAAKRADAVIFVGGLTAQLEGEEGTNGGGDRTDLNLPGRQEQLLEALQAAGKPIAVVLTNGSALGVTYAQAHDNAIVDAWYPGEDGTAVADVLFGDYNPAGRLPVTFYTSVSQLPSFTDYAMKGRTYRYFDGEPLYPFGYGLSYTTFAYSNLQAPAIVAANQPLAVSAQVRNTGTRAGDEVAELYLRPAPDRPDADRRVAADQPMPRLILAGFHRVHLAPGETQTVTFTVAPDQLRLVNDKGEKTLQPGRWRLYIGGAQPELSKPNGGKAVVSSDLTVK